MTAARRSLIIAVILLADSALILLVLTLLFHSLASPAVHTFDLAAQLRIHALASPPLTALLLAFTWLGAIRTFAPALVLIIALLLQQQRRRLAALLGLPMLWALFLNETLKLHFHRARPILPWSIHDEHTFSFPSGHSFFAVVLYGTLTFAALRYRTPPRHAFALLPLTLFLPLIIGISRIYLGEHYPTDVLAGYLAGLLLLPAIVLADRVWVIPPPTLPPDSTPSRASRTGPLAAP